jgi:cytochrome c553
MAEGKRPASEVAGRAMKPARPRRVAGVLVATALIAATAALLFAWSGIYNVAASRGHWAVVDWFLAFGMRHSVAPRARFVDAPPPLDNPDLYILGAAHFHSGCAWCHGAPGQPINPLARQMLPPPPDLAHVQAQWNDRELFWIIRHGIKYTGMPGWVPDHRDDEVWAVVAFVRQLPTLNPEAYRALALGGLPIGPSSGRELATIDAWPSGANACARCHGAEDRRPASALVPSLHGQPREFLAGALHAFARGDRASGIMQPIAAELNKDRIEKLAEFYAGLTAPDAVARSGQGGQASTAPGRALATQGAPSERIPACMVCHGPDALESYPRLAGQNAAYMSARLRRWKAGVTPGTPAESIMAPIARLLSDEQIDAVSAYFESLPSARSAGATRP